MQPVVLTDPFNLDDLKNAVKCLDGFDMGPNFDAYGLLFVDATEKRKMFKITGDAAMKFYCTDKAVPSFFIVKSEAKSQLPITPEPRVTERRIKVETPLTPSSSNPLTPASSSGCKQTPVSSRVKRKIEMVDKDAPQYEVSSPLDEVCDPLDELCSIPKTEPCSSGTFVTDYMGQIQEGACFSNKPQLYLTLQMTKLQLGVDYKVVRSHKKGTHVKCADVNCNFSLRAKQLRDFPYLYITKMTGPHTCSMNGNLGKRIKRVKDALGKYFEEKGINGNYTPLHMQNDIKDVFGRTLSYKQAWLGCHRGVELTKGSPDESYQRLAPYSHMLEIRNPGSITNIKTSEDDVFEYYFMAVGVCLEGFKTFSRPAFAVDGTHLTGDRGGTLLSAVCLDANEQIYPFAFAIVDSENDKACAWFFEQLHDALGADFCENQDLVVCTDRSEPMRKAIELKMPAVCHVFCAYHIRGI